LDISKSGYQKFKNLLAIMLHANLFFLGSEKSAKGNILFLKGNILP
jgi:hypothetical protein